jgi:hypothetical protein
MTGTPALIIESMSVIIPFLLFTVVLAGYLRKRLWPILVVSLIIGAIAAVTTTRFVAGVLDHRFLAGLREAAVSEIAVGSVNLSRPECLKNVIRGLNAAERFAPNHENYRRIEPISILMRDGERRGFRIAESRKRRGAIIQFVHPCVGSTCFAGDGISADLLDTLRECGAWGGGGGP